ncbi:MAG TPA: OmpA family protein [Candidatus Sulfopaludibacter sp.]|jgi:outer membrane protein OmpA-like peptidoglycan-associated protein|nr:OmpA family protein [Candidatus Sulfopaludibacter sp.]
MKLALLLPLFLTWPGAAADIPGSQDPPLMKRYAGSEIIGYHAPKFDEFLVPLGKPTEFTPPAYSKSQKVDGLVSRYTYLAPEGRTPTEVFRNYVQEFQRLNVTTLYQKDANVAGWFGPTLSKAQDEDGLGQILSYNEAEERVLSGKSKDAQPVWYFVFVTAYKDGVIPERLQGGVTKGRSLVHIVMVAPEKMEQRMEFVTAADMAQSLKDTGRVALYGINFDTDKDTIRADSKATLDEITKLLASDPQVKLHVVGHTDNQGNTDYNLDLSRRRAGAVVKALGAASRLDSFGCGYYSPVASNASEEGRAKNRRVELVTW